MKKDYILGLDIGISSVGWGLLELDGISGSRAAFTGRWGLFLPIISLIKS